jgi:formate/nitrite transporter FocA (FNT family)
MFMIPTGILLGAKVSLAEWWMWNQIPVTLGNIVGGFLFTGLTLYVTYKPEEKKEATKPASALGATVRALAE